MAIKDLLYACVECGREAGIKPGDRGEACERCGTRYQRAEGANIRITRPDGSGETKPPAIWLDLLEQRVPLETIRPDRRERVLVRMAHLNEPIRHRGIYLGQVEQFGEPAVGWLTLAPNALTFEPEGATARVWPLLDLTAVQPSSTSLQLKLRRGPVLSLRFLDASALLWEEHIRRAVQRAYTRSDRGQIREFQPRIVCR